MKIICLLLVLMLCSGCAAKPVWEYVQDEPSVQTGVWQQEAYSIEMAIPAKTDLVLEAEGEKLYVMQDGAYELSSHVFLASSMESAVKYLSGQSAEHMTVIGSKRFDLPEYHFAWYTQTEQGGRLCQADLVMDGIRCYAVVTNVAEDEAKAYESVSRQVFSSFGRFLDEGV